MERVYLDHAATTPPDPRVLEAMWPVFSRDWGNPSSIYLEGQTAHRWLDEARARCARLLGAEPSEIIFTSGGTESDNAAIRGVALAQRERGRGDHIVTSQVEHHAVLHTVEQLERDGFRAAYLPCRLRWLRGSRRARGGRRPRDDRADADGGQQRGGDAPAGRRGGGAGEGAQPEHRRPHGCRAGGRRHRHNAGHVLGVDLLSMASHKLYGTKGTGLLYVRRGTPWQPQILGGTQERERRAGTENVAGAFGLAVAMELAWQEREERVAHYRRLRDRLLFELPERVPDTVVTGPTDPDRRLPNSFSCCFRNVEGESVLLGLDMVEIAASSGSACTTGSLEPSHVLTAMGIEDDLAHASLRLTVGKGNTDEQRSSTCWSSSRRSSSACGRSPRASPRSA